MSTSEEEVKNSIYGLGDRNIAYAKYFSGTSYINNLVAPDDNLDVSVDHITCEPACRSSWHIIKTGYQILICTAGSGWFQEEGKAVRAIKPGDSIAIHEGTKYWLGAGKTSWLSCLKITKGRFSWCQKVDDDFYNALT